MGTLSMVNDAYLRIIGYTREEFEAGQVRWDEITPPESRAADEEGIRQVLAEGVSEPYEKEYVRKDGTRVPIVAALGKMPGTGEVAAFVLDISSLRAAQAELARSNEDLQQFAYAASHDLREPLRTVGTYTQLLFRRLGEARADAEVRQFVEFIEEGVGRMQALIEDLLAYAQVTHETDVELTPVRSESVLGTALENLKARMESEGATVTYGPLPEVQGRDIRLVALFQNLIGNALTYRREPARVHISAEPDRDGWRFAVVDNGIGIEREHHDRIFGVFKRLHGRKEYSGSGVGLAICRRIVEQHGGRIWVESEGAGKGSTFYFTLRAAVRGEEASASD
ncbi:MAG: ATP-binding protein [Bryobacteraceae bacterium]|nr:ATP-binding protein [Bryobacteraceae bacterium]